MRRRSMHPAMPNTRIRDKFRVGVLPLIEMEFGSTEEAVETEGAADGLGARRDIVVDETFRFAQSARIAGSEELRSSWA